MLFENRLDTGTRSVALDVRHFHEFAPIIWEVVVDLGRPLVLGAPRCGFFFSDGRWYASCVHVLSDRCWRALVMGCPLFVVVGFLGLYRNVEEGA